MPPSKLSPHKDAIKQALEQEGRSQSELAAQYGVARSTLQQYVKREGITPLPIGAVTFSPDVSREELLEAELSELRRYTRKERRSDVAEERLLEAVRGVVPVPDVKYEAPEPDTGDAKPHVQALLLSDLHAGEVVEPDEISGINEYNWSILVQDRMPAIHKALLSYQANRPYPIEELHIWMLGDMVGGDIHDELARTNEFPAAQQAYGVGMLLGEFVEELVPYYPKIKVQCVHGNHGRVPKKPAAKQAANSFDWLAYQFAATYMSAYDSVTWNIARGNMLLAPIAGLTYLLWHGDGVRSTMPGVPWGGVMRRTNELRKQYAEQGVQLDGFAVGHFHQANHCQNILMNGSVKGPDEWVLKTYGYAEPPRQLLATFNPVKSRLTDVSRIDP